MTRIENAFIRNHFQADYIEEIDGGWETVRNSVLIARKILASPENFPKADFDYIEKQDMELTCFMLQAPIQYII